MLKVSQSFNVTWTDGGKPSESGYFDGAGSMNDLLCCLFAGHEDWHGESLPASLNVMGKIIYGSQLVVTVSIKETRKGE